MMTIATQCSLRYISMCDIGNPGNRGPTRSSDRIKNCSGKEFKDPNFVYDAVFGGKLLLEDKGNFKEKAASCSNINEAVVNEEKKSRRIKKGGSKLSVKVSGVAESRDSNSNEDYENCNLSARAIEWKNRQYKLSQQRIDVLFKANRLIVDKEGSGLFRVETQQNLSGCEGVNAARVPWCEQTSQSSITDSFVSTQEELFKESESTKESVAEEEKDCKKQSLQPNIHIVIQWSQCLNSDSTMVAVVIEMSTEMQTLNDKGRAEPEVNLNSKEGLAGGKVDQPLEDW